MKYKLIERLKEYYKLERFHAIWISLFCIFLNIKFGFKESILLDYGIIIIVFILIQGTYYWEVKLHVLQGKKIYERRILHQFKIFNFLNLFLMLIYPIIVLILHCNNLFLLQLNKVWALLAYIFGVVEHINYYYVQLMYDNKNDWKYLRINKRLKPASLRKDLEENRL